MLFKTSFALCFLTSSVFANSQSFEDFLNQVRKTATDQGVSEATIDKGIF